MADPPERLAELARRVDSAIEDGSLASERAVQLRAAEPLIEVLGWDLRGDAVQPEATLGGYGVDYLLTLEGQPAIAVVTDSPGADLDRAADGLLRPLLDGGHVLRGLATDGRRVALLVDVNDSVYGHAFAVEDVEAHTDALDRFHRSTLEAEIAEDRDQRRGAAQRLADEQESVANAIENEVVAVTGSEVADTVSMETTRFVDELVAELAPSDTEPQRSAAEAKQPDDPGPKPTNDDPSGGGWTERVDPASRSGEIDTRVDATIDNGDDADSKSETPGSPSPANHEPADADESYVARLFGGSSSVGAVGTASPRSTTLGVVRYLLENQELRKSATLPWQVESDVPVLTEERPAPDWIAIELPSADDVYVRPIDDPTTAKTTIEGLAEAVGLRVMFQGDW